MFLFGNFGFDFFLDFRKFVSVSKSVLKRFAARYNTRSWVDLER
jgi:hypothetical protein